MRAIISGGRYVLHSPSIRPIIVRSIIRSLAGSVLLALMTLIDRDLLGGDARLFGLLLGCYGIGAVIGRSEEHTSELQSLMRTSYAFSCLIHTSAGHPYMPLFNYAPHASL